MEESSEKQKIKSDRLFYMAFGWAALFAITWGLPSFFNWIFFALTAYTFFLSWYVKPKAPKPQYQQRSYTRTSATGDFTIPVNDNATKIRRTLVVVAVVVFGIFFLLFLIGLFAGDDEGSSSETYDVIANDYRDALRENPNDVDALTNVGNQFFENQQYDSAHFYYDRVIQLDSKNAAALYNKGLIYYNQQEYEKSIDFLKRCIDANPDYTDAYLIMGHDYYDRQLQDQSLEWYSKAYDKGMKNAFLSHVLAYLYDNKGNTVKAIPLYKEAVELDSSRYDVYTRLAELEPANAAKYNELAERWKSN